MNIDPETPLAVDIEARYVVAEWKAAEVWCAECNQPSLADFTVKGETVALCVKHIADRFPSELTESEKRLMDGNR